MNKGIYIDFLKYRIKKYQLRQTLYWRNYLNFTMLTFEGE